uniref:Uncharacterized protein n=1 Tax=Anguilla anguilla TaxID=7936 RepID=A0A0E9RZA4_ANGAN
MCGNLKGFKISFRIGVLLDSIPHQNSPVFVSTKVKNSQL